MITSTNNEMNLQPENLANDLIKLVPLRPEDFESLYSVAADPLIWEQHPNRDRCERDVFQNFFDEAIKSKNAFIILDLKNDETIGSSRFYEYEKEKKSVAIGYTFLAREYWGGIYNRTVKSIMLDYAFQYVDTVIFHIAGENLRSQKAADKIGAKKTNLVKETFNGDLKIGSLIFELKKIDWENK